MSPDEITRRLLDHFSTGRGWHPLGECYCASCSEGCGCEVPGIFEALGLPVPEPTYTPAPRPAVTRVDMGAVKQLEDSPGALFSLVSKLVDTSAYRHDRVPFTVVSLAAEQDRFWAQQNDALEAVAEQLRPTPPA